MMYHHIIHYRPLLLAIENPQSAGIDMGRNSFLMPKVKKAFDHAHRVLLHCLTRRREGEAMLSLIINVDDPILTSRSVVNRVIGTDEGSHTGGDDSSDVACSDAASEEDVDVSVNSCSRGEKKSKKKKEKRRKRKHTLEECVGIVDDGSCITGGDVVHLEEDDDKVGGSHRRSKKSQSSRKRRRIISDQRG